MKIIMFSLLIFSLQACSDNKHEAYKKVEPAKVIKENTRVPRISLTQKAYERLGISSVIVRVSDGDTEVKNSAVIFDTDGKTWVFVQESGLYFHREEVVLNKVSQDGAFISFINPHEYQVVISGAAELYGTESGVGK